MELTKYTHATVVLSKGDTNLVIDPGAYTPNSAELVAATTAVLVTHDHGDHFDAGILQAALEARSTVASSRSRRATRSRPQDSTWSCSASTTR